MSLKINGVVTTQNNMRALKKRYSEGIADALIVGGQMVRTTAIKNIQKKSDGDEVIRYREGTNTPYKHTAAKKGDAPNTDTGKLVGSIQVEVKDKDVFVGSNLNYAKYLEFGDHPFLVPALQENKPKIIKLIKKAVKK